ncbi:MAG: hypothetical protein U9M97_03450 [Candidatus Hadarchaeota archaeon]|nr:hypothetical protein [Candidatus Hadarchaeota archaeon]
MMKPRAFFLVVAFIMTVMGGLCASGWMAVAQDILPIQVVMSAFETPVSFLICAQADAESYVFEFLGYPTNGIIVGMLPELVYAPNPGFYGLDSAEIAVYAKAGGQLVDVISIQMLVLSPQVEVSPPSLGFTGDVMFGPPLDVEGASFTAFYHQNFTYFSEDIRALWEEGAFNSLRSDTRFTLLLSWDELSMKFPITSTLDFDPSVPKLKSWSVNTSTDLLDWTLGYRFYFSGDETQTRSYTELTAKGRLGDIIDCSGRVKFRGLGAEFSEFSLTTSASLDSLGWMGCDIKWESGLSFTKDEGFREGYFKLLDIPIPFLDFTSFNILLDTELTFTSVEKSLEPSLRLVSDWDACLKPLLSLESPPAGIGITGIELYGVELRCDFTGGVTGRFATSFNLLKDASVTGDSHFFELWQFSGPVVSCCGSPTKWQLSVYFSRGAGSLFNVRRMDAIIYEHLSPELLIYFGLKLGLVDPSDSTKTWLLKAGWRGLW